MAQAHNCFTVFSASWVSIISNATQANSRRHQADDVGPDSKLTHEKIFDAPHRTKKKRPAGNCEWKVWRLQVLQIIETGKELCKSTGSTILPSGTQPSAQFGQSVFAQGGRNDYQRNFLHLFNLR